MGILCHHLRQFQNHRLIPRPIDRVNGCKDLNFEKRTFFVRQVATMKKVSWSSKFREKKHLFGGDHAFLGNLYQVYKMIIHQVLLMMGVWEIHVSLVDGFIPPIWNIWSSNWIILPKYRGKNKDYLSNHHLGFGSERTKLTKYAFPKRKTINITVQMVLGN